MSFAANTPLRKIRLCALALTWAMDTAAGCLGLNALIRSNQQQTKLRHSVPSGTKLQFDVRDTFQSGTIATALFTFAALLCFNYVTGTLVSFGPLSKRSKTPLAKILKIEGGLLAFALVVCSGALIPYTYFVNTRSAGVKAFIGPFEVPESVIKQGEAALGQTSVYKHIWFLRTFLIAAWIAWAITLITTVVLFVAAGRATSYSPSSLHSHDAETTTSHASSARSPSDDKPHTEMTEKREEERVEHV